MLHAELQPFVPFPQHGWSYLSVVNYTLRSFFFPRSQNGSTRRDKTADTSQFATPACVPKSHQHLNLHCSNFFSMSPHPISLAFLLLRAMIGRLPLPVIMSRKITCDWSNSMGVSKRIALISRLRSCSRRTPLLRLSSLLQHVRVFFCDSVSRWLASRC